MACPAGSHEPGRFFLSGCPVLANGRFRFPVALRARRRPGLVQSGAKRRPRRSDGVRGRKARSTPKKAASVPFPGQNAKTCVFKALRRYRAGFCIFAGCPHSPDALGGAAGSSRPLKDASGSQIAWLYAIAAVTGPAFGRTPLSDKRLVALLAASRPARSVADPVVDSAVQKASACPDPLTAITGLKEPPDLSGEFCAAAMPWFRRWAPIQMKRPSRSEFFLVSTIREWPDGPTQVFLPP